MRRNGVLLVVLMAVAACGSARQTVPPEASLAPSSPSPALSASPSVTPDAPSPSVALTDPPTVSLRWERIAQVDASDPAGDWRSLAGSGIGYVTISQGRRAIWFSSDGVEWSKVKLGVPTGTVVGIASVAATDEAILVGGSYSPCTRRSYDDWPFGECRPRPVSWTSTDGVTWVPSAAWEGPLGEDGRHGSLFSATWSLPAGGWEAMQAFDPSDDSDDFELIAAGIWDSADGRTWTEEFALPNADMASSEMPVSGTAHGGADDTGRHLFATIGDELGSSIWTSSDGRTYRQLAGLVSGPDVPVVAGVLPAVGDRPWTLVGWLVRSDGEAARATTWWSTDLEHWTEDPLPGGDDGLALRATAAGDRDVAVGRSGSRRAMTWVRADGAAWQAIEGEPPPIEAVASGPVGVLGLVGVWNSAGEEVTGFEVWRLVEGRP